MSWKLAVLLAVAALGAWNWWSRERVVDQPPGVLAPDEPRQVDVAAGRRIVHHGYDLIPRAHYDITARVLRKEIYRLDGGAGLAPVDLGVGWGPMSDSAVLDHIRFSQMGRFLYWDARDGAFPIPAKVLQTDDALEARLKRLRPGQIVHVQGWLVDIRGPGGFMWSTSLRRDDIGDGACEIVFVESLDVDD
jgi:hypothetical protein